MLSGYWQADMDPKLLAAVLADWADELQDWNIGQVKWGLREWRRENPRRKPNPGDIVAVLKRRRGDEFAAKLAALPKPEPERPQPITAERASAILAEVGFNVRRIPTVQE